MVGSIRFAADNAFVTVYWIKFANVQTHLNRDALGTGATTPLWLRSIYRP